MKTEEALSVLCGLLGPGELAVSANGVISRELYAAGHRDGNFYMLGSMGHASSIALGIALARPDRRVVVFDGDGSLIMNMGILATVRQYRPRNFLHVVLDNAVYNTTGGQPTAAAVVDLAKVAKAAGYRHVAVAKTKSQVKRSGRKVLALKGPAMLVVKVKTGRNPDLVRIQLSPEQIKRRFRKAASGRGRAKPRRKHQKSLRDRG